MKRYTVVLVLLAVSNLAFGQTLDAAKAEADFGNALSSGYYRVAPGSYVVTNVRSDKSYSLYFQCNNNNKAIHVDFTGVTLEFTDIEKGGIQFHNCNKLKFTGATLKWNPLPFTQGWITSLSSNVIGVQIADGYPTSWLTGLASPFAWALDRSTGYFKQNSWDINQPGIKVEYTGSWNRYNLRFTGSQAPLDGLAVNDYIVIRGKCGPHALLAKNTGSSEFSSLQILSAPCFGILELDAPAANTFNLIQIKPGSKPQGASMNPLISTTADGIHAINPASGPTITNCKILQSGDDAINIHGRWSLVVSADRGSRKINVVDKDKDIQNVFQKGDSINIYDTDFRWIGSTTIDNVYKPSSYKTSASSTTMKTQLNPLDQWDRVYTELQLASWGNFWKDPNFDYFVSNPSRNGRRAVVSNNEIRNNRGRGILYKGWDGSITNNVIDGSSMGGITLFPEVADFVEGDFSRNVLIKSNTVNWVSFAKQQMGGIMMSANYDRDSQGKLRFAPGYGFDNITIEDNHFWSIPFTNVLVSSAANIVIRKNDFHGALCSGTPPNGMQFVGIDFHKIIWATEASNIKHCQSSMDKLGFPCSGTDYYNAFGQSESVKGTTTC